MRRPTPNMSKAADGTTEAPSDLPDDTNAMHTDRTEVQNAAATWRYDASSGRTIERESVWITRGRKGKRDAGGKTTQEATPTKEETSTQQSQPQRRKPTMPPLPFDDYKVVYRPQAGLELAKWNNIAIVHAIGKASGFAQQDFSEKVCVQVQRLENLIIASTAEWEDAKKLESITSIQLGGTLFTIKSNTRTPDDVSRGVISGLLPGTSEEELKAGLRAPARYTVLHARMLGQSSTAVIFFQGPHVPYYVRFHSLDFRCRPYRKSVQYCKTCGNTGHRQDVCPRPLPGFCSKCGKTNQPPDHMCKPACKLCGEEHETASKDCKKRLKPNPPPFHIRQQRMDRIKARDCRWSLADEEFPELTSQTTNLHSSADGAPTRGRSRSALRPRSRSRSRSRSCSPKRVSYANVASGSSGSETTSRSTFLSPENEALRVLQDKATASCAHCRQRPCLLEQGWVPLPRRASMPAASNSGKRKRAYRRIWRALERAGFWREDEYRRQKPEAPGPQPLGTLALHSQREVMPACIVERVRELLPNPPGVTYSVGGFNVKHVKPWKPEISCQLVELYQSRPSTVSSAAAAECVCDSPKGPMSFCRPPRHQRCGTGGIGKEDGAGGHQDIERYVQLPSVLIMGSPHGTLTELTLQETAIGRQHVTHDPWRDLDLGLDFDMAILTWTLPGGVESFRDTCSVDGKTLLGAVVPGTQSLKFHLRCCSWSSHATAA
ncbi:hypothetical protein HPB50_017930 [Hyalomma asiaticum]|uniref:Uncharacterized protein n=1 Tax=Hyalomma asiaticum TaxID=266040 RepID=A0ACB7T975_HYAAI|nr:hypothetical protein HPB50_017930 [Hyalomma asiaticum]